MRSPDGNPGKSKWPSDKLMSQSLWVQRDFTGILLPPLSKDLYIMCVTLPLGHGTIAQCFRCGTSNLCAVGPSPIACKVSGEFQLRIVNLWHQNTIL